MTTLYLVDASHWAGLNGPGRWRASNHQTRYCARDKACERLLNCMPKESRKRGCNWTNPSPESPSRLREPNYSPTSGDNTSIFLRGKEAVVFKQLS